MHNLYQAKITLKNRWSQKKKMKKMEASKMFQVK